MAERQKTVVQETIEQSRPYASAETAHFSIRSLDLHMHSTVSDGTDTPEEILQKVRSLGLSLFSLSDHDAAAGCEEILRLRTEEDPLFLTGVEFSTRDEHGKYHILGYRYDPEAEAVREAVKKAHALRMSKVTDRIAALKDRFGFSFSEEDIAELLSLSNPGKPHLANLMVRYGYVQNKEEAFSQYLDLIRFPSRYLRPEEAIAAILESGGIPILAHPLFGSGDELILGAEMEERLQRLMDYGLQGVEGYYSGFSAKLSTEILTLADRYDLLVTAGSDYHGSNKLVRLGDTGLLNIEDAVPGLQRFLKKALG